ncbi:MAG: carbohydrate-binding protein [Verrucomicrobia bacterium]|nr:carbohydrate-binding protein [Verrucomicrobiota bacterium]
MNHLIPLTKRAASGPLGVVMLLALTAIPALSAAPPAGRIVVAADASLLEQYAAQELQRYIYQISGSSLEIGAKREPTTPCFVIAPADRLAAMKPAGAESWPSVTVAEPGPQGYVLKKLTVSGQEVLVIGGSDEIGCLYGVYGLLEEHYGVGFYLGGDVLPDKKAPLVLPEVDERKAPAVQIRGFLPWTNFPQSATVYSWDDWRFIIDQAAKMRFNFIHIHNYNGEQGHNEMFHNFEVGGKLSRVWMPTARTGHSWGCSGWDVAQYRFGAADLFDDYDFGADCALHNESLSNRDVFRKGASLFQRIIAHAHSRGVRIGLGIDINIIPEEYKKTGAKAEDPPVVAARVEQIATDYPDLDYLLCFQSENVGHNAEFFAIWRKIFMGFHEGFKTRSSPTRLAVSGWGLNPKAIEELPAEVICAPIASYTDRCESGAIYGKREYWGCPWLERDWNSSQYYYPYNMHLSNTIKAWRERAPNMTGFYCLSWRVTDAVEPRLSFISKAPWDKAERLKSSAAVYHEYAAQHYGPEAADDITKIINENEPYVCGFAECQGTPEFEAGVEGECLYNVGRFKVSGADPAAAKEYSPAASSANNGPGVFDSKDGGKCLGNIRAGHWVRFDDLDFGKEARSCEVRVAAHPTEGKGGIIELRLDGPSGKLLGSGRVTQTGGWQTWVSVRFDITPTSGRHKLCMCFRAEQNSTVVNIAKADEQLAMIDQWLKRTESPARRANLQRLRCRIAATRDHNLLLDHFSAYNWPDLPGAIPSWVGNFTHRVTDISSLGNVTSMQNRFIQLRYVAKENELRGQQAVKSPSHVNARGTRQGAVIQWQNEEPNVAGFNVYRDGRKINSDRMPAGATGRFTDRVNGSCRYTVTAVNAGGQESPPSVPIPCDAGGADRTPPTIVVISPPTSAQSGQPVSIKARLLDGRIDDSTGAVLWYRRPGDAKWLRGEMARKVKSIFVANIPVNHVTAAGLEYYIEATDGDNAAAFPPSAPAMPLSWVVTDAAPHAAPASPGGLTVRDQALQWNEPGGDVFWYHIYRGDKPDFGPGPATRVTYVAKGTTGFKDTAAGFDGQPLRGIWHYRVTAVDFAGNESPATATVAVEYPASNK